VKGGKQTVMSPLAQEKFGKKKNEQTTRQGPAGVTGEHAARGKKGRRRALKERKIVRL